MKTLILELTFPNDKIIKKEIDVDNTTFDFLTLGYKQWGPVMDKYVSDESKWYDNIFAIQANILNGILKKHYGIEPNEWVMTNEDFYPNSLTIEMDID
jgi:hypothetical protein